MHITIEAHTPSRVVTMTRRDGTPDLAALQNIVRGMIATGFRLDSETRPGVTIDYWVNDEGLCFSGNPVVRYDVGPYDSELYLAGDGVFTAADREGETVAMTLDECRMVERLVMPTFAGVTC